MAEEDDNDDWMNEDPNLLNNPELLYRECEKLPFPDEISHRAGMKEMWDIQKIVREMILDNNVLFDQLSKQEGIRGTEEEALAVIINITEAIKSKFEKCVENSAELQNQEDSWDADNMQEIFSHQGSERILQWKATLNEFLKCYSNIRKFIPKDTSGQTNGENEQDQNAEIEMEKKQLNCLPDILEELDDFKEVLHKFLEL